MIGKRIFKLGDHPETLEWIFREYEIVRTTPKFYVIERRNVPSQAAQRTQFRIRKEHVSNGHFADYYCSRPQLIDLEIRRRRMKIDRALSLVSRLEEEIGVLRVLVETIPAEEYSS